MTTTTATQVAAAYQVILQASPPGGASGAYATSLAAQIDGGYLTFSDYESSLLSLDQTMYTTAAALVTIDAFYDATPSQATLATVATATSGTTYSTALELHNLGYSDANVWTVLGANWGADPNSSFFQLYSGLDDGSTNSYTTFIDEVYTRIFGSGPTAANLQNLLNDIPGLTALLSGGGNTATTLQVMGGLFGYLLYAGQSTNTGVYASAANAFLTEAANDEAALPGSSAALYGPALTLSSGASAAVIDAATIAATNSALGSDTVVVTTAASGNVTVTIENTAGLIAEGGIVIQGNANIMVNDVDGGIGNTSDLGQIVVTSGDGNNTIDLSVGVTDSVTGGSGSTDIVLDNGFKMSGANLYYDDGYYDTSSNYFYGPQTFKGGTGTSNTITVLGTADLSAGVIHNIQTIDLASGAVATFSAAELAADLAQPVPAVTPPLEPSISVAAGGTGSVIITGGGSVNLTGKLSGVTSLTVDDGAIVTLGTADITALTSVSTQVQGTASGEIITTVAGAETLLALDPNLSFGLSDTPADLLAAPASVLADAQTVVGSVTIAEAVVLHKLAPNATYTVSDTPTDIQDALVFNDDDGALVTADANEIYTAPATVTQAEQFSAAGLQDGNGISIVDTAANVGTALANDALPAFNSSLTGETPNGIYSIAISGTATAAEAAAIAGFVASSDVKLGFVSFSGTFSIVDSITDLENVSAAAVTMATSVSILPGAAAVRVNDISVAEAAVAKGGKTLTGTYSLDDLSSSLLAAPAVLRGASSVTVNDSTIGVAVAAQIVNDAAPAATVKFQTLSDTAADLSAVPLTVLQDATTVEVTGTANVSQSAYLAQYVPPNSIPLVDSGANLAAASAAVLANAASITITGAVTATQAVAIDNELTALNLSVPTYSIADSAANLIAIVTAKGYSGSVAQTVLDDATKVTVSDGTITVAQAQELYNAGITNLAQYNISDTVANVVAAAATPDVMIGAATVTATGPSTVQQAETLTSLGSEFVGGYSIVDTPANIIAALSGHLALLNGSASPVTFIGSYAGVVTVGGVPTITVNQATALETSGLTNWSGTYTLADSIANLKAAPAQDIAAANGNVYALDNVNDLNNGANLLWVKANTKGFIVQDTFADINANQAIGAGAVEVVITDPALSAANAKTLSTINPNSLFDLADTAGNLTTAALVADAGGIKLASEVTVTGGMTVANAKTLLGLNANTAFSLLDTGADLAASGATATVGLAAGVVVSGGATVSQAAAIVAAATLADTNGSVVYSLTDTTDDIQEATTATVDGASAVTVTNGNRVTLNVAEVDQFNIVPSAMLTGWTSSAPGDAGAAVTYNLSDTMADLASAPLLTVHDAGTVTAVAGGTAVTAAQVAAVEAQNQFFSGSYNLNDSISNLLAYSPITKGASSVTVTGTVSVSQATALLKLSSSATFTLNDTAADLTASAAAAVVKTAAKVTISAPASVASVQMVEALNGSVTYSLSDNAADLAGASSSLLKGATTISFTTSPTVAQITAIDKALGTDIYVPTGVADTAANIAAAPQALLNASGNVTALAASTATAAQGLVLENLTDDFGSNNITFTVTDTAANIASVGVSFDHATSIEVTGTATAAQATVLSKLRYNGGGSQVQYAVADSAANLLISTDGWASGADVSSITVTDASVNIATAYQIYSLNSGLGASSHITYVISDTQDRIVEALGQFGQGPTGIDLNVVLGHATSLSIGGTTAVPLMAVGGTYVVDGSIATLGGLSSAVLAAAGSGITGGYVVVDTIANEQANLTTTDAGYFGDYVIADTTADITSAAPSFVQDAHQVRITDPATTYADVEAVKHANSINGLNDVVFSLTDTAANLFSGGILKADASQATSITVTNAVTVADANSLLANHPTNDTYSISDTEVDLFNGSSTVLSGDVAAVKAAGSVTINGSEALSDNQAASLVGYNSNATYSIVDNPANLFTTVNGVLTLKPEVGEAATVSVAGANLTVAQAELLTGLGNKFVGNYNLVDSSADLAGASSTVLQGASTIVQNDLGTGGATIAQAASIVAGLGSSTKLPANFTVTDTVANIAGASQSLLTDIKSLSVSAGSTATAVQAEQLAGLTYDGSAKSAIVYDVKDTSTNILSSSDSSGIVAATLVIGTDQINVATAGQIYALNHNDQFSLKDMSTAFGISAVVQDATAVEVTDAVNVGEATVLQGDFSAGTAYTFDTVSDTYANLSNPANLSLVGHATVIDVTGATSVADAEQLQADYGAKVNLSSVALSDTAGAIVNAYYDTDNAPIVADAASVTVASSASVAQAQILEGLHIAANTTFGITDTLQFISQAYQNAPGVLNSSDVNGITVRANENDSGVATSFTDIGLKNVDVLFSHAGSGSGETISLSGSTYSLSGVDLLNLNAADTLDLNGYGITVPGPETTSATLPGAGSSTLIQGQISNNGANFMASATGSNALLLWNSGGETSGVLLVSAIPHISVA